MKKLLFIFCFLPLLGFSQIVQPAAAITDPNPGPFINLAKSLDSTFINNAGTASQVQYFIFVTGNLTHAVGWKAPSGGGMEISASSTGGWTDTLTFTGGSVIVDTVFVRVAAATNAGSYSGNIHGASATDATQNVPYAATVNAVPTVSASPSSFSGMTSTAGNLGGSVTTTVSGSALTGNITAGPLGGFKVSLDNVTFATTQTLVPSSGSISHSLYIALSDTNTSGLHSGNLPLSGGGASTFNIAVSGTTSAPTTTPDSARFQFDTSSANDVSGWTIVRGDPSLHVISGTIPSTTITYTTVSKSSANWTQLSGACIGINNGVTNATIPYASNTGVMKEAVLTAAAYQTTNPQFISGGWKTDGTLYDIELSGTTQYPVNSVASYSVKGASLQANKTINGQTNTNVKATWTSVAPDASGNFSFYMGFQAGNNIALLSYIIIRKH